MTATHHHHYCFFLSFQSMRGKVAKFSLKEGSGDQHATGRKKSVEWSGEDLLVCPAKPPKTGSFCLLLDQCKRQGGIRTEADDDYNDNDDTENVSWALWPRQLQRMMMGMGAAVAVLLGCLLAVGAVLTLAFLVMNSTGEAVMMADESGALRINTSDPRTEPVLANGVNVKQVFELIQEHQAAIERQQREVAPCRQQNASDVRRGLTPPASASSLLITASGLVAFRHITGSSSASLASRHLSPSSTHPPRRSTPPAAPALVMAAKSKLAAHWKTLASCLVSPIMRAQFLSSILKQRRQIPPSSLALVLAVVSGQMVLRLRTGSSMASRGNLLPYSSSIRLPTTPPPSPA